MQTNSAKRGTIGPSPPTQKPAARAQPTLNQTQALRQARFSAHLKAMLEIAKTFKFNEYKIRTVNIDGQHWFVAQDICEAIGLKSTPAAVYRLPENEKLSVDIETGVRGTPARTVISWDGLMSLTDRSYKRWAKALQKWAKREILPAINQTAKEESTTDSGITEDEPKTPVPVATETFTNGIFTLEIAPYGDGFKVSGPSLAKALGFASASDMTRSIPEDEKGSGFFLTPGGIQKVSYVNESGFYRVVGQRQVARIKDPRIRTQAEQFQNWVFKEVIPTIRKTNGYAIKPEPHPAIDDRQAEPHPAINERQAEPYPAMDKAHAELELCKAAKGLVDDDFLQSKVRAVLNRALGTNTHEHEARSGFWAYGV